MKKKLAIVSTHPIQYNAPLFKALAERNEITIKVFFTWGESVLQNKFDPGFGKVIEWNIPTLDGYDYTFLENVAADKGSHHFKGIINPGIITAVEEFNPDVLLVYGWSFSSHLAVMKYFKGKIPVFFRGDSTLLDDTSFIKSFTRQLVLRYIYRFVDKAFYVGKNNESYFVKAGLKPAQLVYAPHVVDNTRFECADATCRQLAVNYRTQLQIAETDFVFLFAGKFEQKKDPVLLLNAFLAASFPGFTHLVLVGNGALEPELKQLAGENRQVHFMEFQNQMQMPAVYQMADVFVLPSKGPGETWGLAVNEAMASGKAIIASDRCGCTSNLVEDGVNGYQFEAGNQAALSDKLKAIISSNEELAKMKQASKDKINNFSIPVVASIIEREVVAVNANKSLR